LGGVVDVDEFVANEVGWQQLLLVGGPGERRRDDVPAIGHIAKPADRRHHRALSRDREFYRRATDCVGLLDIGFGGNVACRPQEVIGNRPMALAAQLRAYQVGNEWRYPAQLCMAKGVLQARSREELSVWSFDPFRHGDNALVVSRQSLLDFAEKALLIELDLGQQQDVWSIAFVIGGERTSGGCPAG